MKALHNRLTLAVATLCFWSALTVANAAETLPKADPIFHGAIDPTLERSKPDWPKPLTAPAGAPNVVVILLDDVGYAATDVFGGPVATPELGKLAARGLRYNNFNTTALCSPTRAALLSGRNHHRMGFGSVTETDGGFPGYNMYWKKSTASIADVLRQNGYSTAAFGKWHNTPVSEVSPVGPFDRWPTGLGFEYFYGFMAGEDNQWQPRVYRNTTAVEQPANPKTPYHFTTDMANDAIDWVQTHCSVAPDRPFFLYFAPGATHAPHHVPKEWIEPYRGKFDQGWDKLREEIFARQKKLGIIPANAELTPRPNELPAWESLSQDTRRLVARQMEVYAGFLAQTDHEVGRLLQAVESGPGGDNTLLFYIVGDNGASGEGGLEGSDHNISNLGTSDPVKDQLPHMDDLGSVLYDNHYSSAWAWGLDTPFQWMKQVASHFGGTRDPLIVSWPARIKDHGGLRTQFTHVIDVVPTIFEATGIPVPVSVNGITQDSIDGTSFAYTFDHSTAASQHRVQYFEMLGNRAIYQDGWVASARHSYPWMLGKMGGDFSKDRWELYHVAEDFSETHDLAAQNPDKLAALQKLFDTEARKNNVYPLGGARSYAALRPPTNGRRKEFVYHEGLDRMPVAMAPAFTQAHRITAKIFVPNSANGVIVSYGSTYGGFVLYVKDGRVIYDNNDAGRTHDILAAKGKLAMGVAEIAYEYVPDAPPKIDIAMPVGTSRGTNSGTGKLYVNGKLVGEGKISHVQPAYFGSMGIGRAFDSPVPKAGVVPDAFTGSIEELRVELN